MASERFLLIAALSLSTCAALPPLLRAEDASQSDNDAKHVFVGEVNAATVFVRSRASEDGLNTMKLSKGSRVTVVGIKGNWLKIQPPEGSFAYVPKSFIEMRADGTVGRANRETIAHAGSDLNDLVSQPPLAKIEEGEDVQIIGQHNEYFKITPPKGSFLWINKQFVTPVETVTPEGAKPGPKESSNTGGPDNLSGPVVEGNTRPGPDTRPSGTEVARNNDTSPPATQPAEPTSIADYDKLEEQFKGLAGKPMAEQPLPELLAGYEKLLAADDLPVSMRSIAEERAATLKVRNDVRAKYLALQDNQKKMAEKRQALIAEQEEIANRIKENDIQIFAAVGTLRPSSLQVGQGMLYRLTDPATGRTVAYVRTSDAKYAQFLGQFIGVRGTITNDPQLKSMIENPIEALPVDQSKINTKVAAQIVPPSLVKFVAVAPAQAAPSTQPASGNPASGASDQASTASEPQ
jgi:uncharacterized protein YgiM (DUF1202 family)